jgi:hypothetical protein
VAGSDAPARRPELKTGEWHSSYDGFPVIAAARPLLWRRRRNTEGEAKNHGSWSTPPFLPSASRRRRFSWIPLLHGHINYGINHRSTAFATAVQRRRWPPLPLWLLCSAWSRPTDASAAVFCLICSVTHLLQLPPPPMSLQPVSPPPLSPPSILAPAAPTLTTAAGSLPGPPGTALPTAPGPTTTVLLLLCLLCLSELQCLNADYGSCSSTRNHG